MDYLTPKCKQCGSPDAADGGVCAGCRQRDDDRRRYLHHVLQHHRLTQAKLARELGCSQNLVWSISAGRRRMTDRMLRAIELFEERERLRYMEERGHAR